MTLQEVIERLREMKVFHEKKRNELRSIGHCHKECRSIAEGVTEMKQWYVFEMNGFTEEEAQGFFNRAFAKFELAEEHSMRISHLTDEGVANLKKHVFKQEEPK